MSPGDSRDSGKRLCASRHELSPLRAASSSLGAIAKGGVSSPSEMKAPLWGSGRQQGGTPPPGTGAWFKAVHMAALVCIWGPHGTREAGRGLGSP